MANCVAFDFYPQIASTLTLPTSRKNFTSAGLIRVQRESLPTDPVRNINISFANIVVGSEIRIIDYQSNEVAGVETCVANQVLTTSLYVSGSPNNNVIIRIISLGYVILEISLALSDDTVIPVQQRIDRNYLNP